MNLGYQAYFRDVSVAIQFVSVQKIFQTDAAILSASKQPANAENCLQFFSNDAAATAFTQVGLEQAPASAR